VDPIGFKLCKEEIVSYVCMCDGGKRWLVVKLHAEKFPSHRWSVIQYIKSHTV